MEGLKGTFWPTYNPQRVVKTYRTQINSYLSFLKAFFKANGYNEKIFKQIIYKITSISKLWQYCTFHSIVCADISRLLYFIIIFFFPLSTSEAEI